jgi:hypothetical protein
METGSPQSPSPVTPRRDIRPLYWLAAAAMAISIALEFFGDDGVDPLKVGSRSALLVALLLLATARPAETKAKKWLIYGLVAVALGLLLARLLR